MDRCPAPDLLRQLLADQLDPCHRDHVGRHVDGCIECQQMLESLTRSTLAFPQPSPSLPHSPSADFVRRLKLVDPSGVDRGSWIVDHENTPTNHEPRTTNHEPCPWPALPGFEILGELGRGGMGVVYKARQVGLNRLVALKMVLAGARASKELRARFRNEAEAVARLQHPNIVQVFEVGEHEGQAYFALELVEGGNLAQSLNGTPQPAAAAAALVETLARAIQDAHKRGIIHRDLKPANILLAGQAFQPDGRDQVRLESLTYVPKITDFGLAKLLDAQSDLTRTGDLVGTPSYLAPEQARIDSRPADPGNGLGPATDIYALGAILYEMLTGRPPFRAATPMETVLQVLYQEPVPPSHLQPKVPVDLATICLKCLEKEPARRYASAHALAEDLRRFQEGEPIQARRVGPMGRLWRWSRRRPVLAGLAAALLMSLLGGLAGMTVLWLLAEDNRRQAEGNARTAERRRQEAEASQERAEANLYLGRLVQARLAWRLNDVKQSNLLLDQCVPQPGQDDLRGWEWHYLKTLTTAGLATISTGHENEKSLVFTADGNRLLVAGGDPYTKGSIKGDVQIWDLVPTWRAGRSPALVQTLGKQGDMVCSLVLSSDGRLLASGGFQGTVRLWDLATGQERQVLRGHSGRVLALALSPDGSRLASADATGKVLVWDTHTGVRRLALGVGSWVRFDPTGKFLITADHPPDLRQNLEKWDAEDGRALGPLPLAGSCWEFSPDGKMVVTWQEREVRIVEWASGQVVTTLSGHTGPVSAARFSPDALHVATAGADQTVRLWNAATGAEELLLRGHTGRVSCLAFHPCGRYLVSGSHQPGEVKVWDLTRQPEFQRAGGLPGFPRSPPGGLGPGPALALGFTGDSSSLLLAYRNQAVQACDPRGGPVVTPPRWLGLLRRSLVPATMTAFSADGRKLAGVPGRAVNQVVLWDPATGHELLTLRGHSVPVSHLAWSRDGRRLATSGALWDKNRCRREVKVWDTATGKLLVEFQPAGCPGPGQPRLFGVAALSPDGERVAFDFLDQEGHGPQAEVRIKVCEVDGGREVMDLAGGPEWLTALVFSPDGRHLTGGGWNQAIRLWDLASEGMRDEGRRMKKDPGSSSLIPHPSSLIPSVWDGPFVSLGDLAFSPDGRLLAAADRDQVKLWHVPWGQEILLLRGAPPRARDNAFNPRVAWSPDGRYLAALNHDLSVSIWDRGQADSPATRFRSAEEHAFAWHLAHAQSAVLQPGQRFAAQFHLQILKELKPPHEDLGLGRGVLYAWLGQWQEAATEFRQAHAHQPLQLPERAFTHALLQLRAGDKAEWGKACLHLGRLLERTADPVFAEHLTRAWLLAARARTDPEPLKDLLRAGPPESENRLLLGAACYRAGRFDEAIQHCQALAATEPSKELAPRAWLFLAMAQARRGQIELARQWLTRLETWVARHRAGLAKDSLLVIPPTVNWKLWVEVDLLHQEARAVLQQAKRKAMRPSESGRED